MAATEDLIGALDDLSEENRLSIAGYVPNEAAGRHFDDHPASPEGRS